MIVTFNRESSYCLTVINRAKFDVFLHDLEVSPDGFPEPDNGWLFSESNVFRNKKLLPGEKIEFNLSSKDFGNVGTREFIINYNTIIFGKKVPIPRRSKYLFDRDSQSIHVVSSVTMNIESS